MPVSSVNLAIRIAVSRWRQRIQPTAILILRHGGLPHRALKGAGGLCGSPGWLVTRPGGSRRLHSGTRQPALRQLPMRPAPMYLNARSTVATTPQRECGTFDRLLRPEFVFV